MNGLSISQAAERSGVKRETLRYYESQGLIHAARTEGGFRSYSPSVVDQIQFIKRAQNLGFTLREIAELLSFEAAPEVAPSHVRELAIKKLAEVDGKLDEMAQMRGVLSELIHRCPGTGEGTSCPILETLTEGAT